MKGKLILFLLFATCYLFASQWYPDFRKGVEVAKKEGKLVLVYFYEEGCSYCRYMEEAVFVEPEVSSLMDKAFVVIPIDTENIPGYLDRRFRVYGTPSFFIYDPIRDKIVMQIFGMHESDEFLNLLKRACSKVRAKSC